jgi:tRNA (guanine-N7-)-methyltransferase
MRVRKHANPLNFSKDKETINLDKIFSNTHLPLVLEIGFAHGEYILQRAKKETDKNFIGFEVRAPLVEKIQNIIDSKQINNLKVFHASSAVNLDILPNDSVTELIVFFPDPCFKTKHHKRRIVNPKFLHEIKSKLKKDNQLYFQTDVFELYKQTLSYINNDPSYTILSTKIEQAVANITGEVSFFENRCLINNWDIHRILFRCH